MALEPVSRFQLDPKNVRTTSLSGGASFDRLLLLADGAATDLYVRDGQLAAQFRSRHGFLLIVESDTCVWESGAQFLLLADDLRVLDVVDMHVPWQPGCVADVVPAGEDAVDFVLVFRWRVVIRGRPRLLPQPEEWIGWPLSRSKDYGPVRRWLEFDRRDRRFFWQR